MPLVGHPQSVWFADAHCKGAKRAPPTMRSWRETRNATKRHANAPKRPFASAAQNGRPKTKTDFGKFGRPISRFRQIAKLVCGAYLRNVRGNGTNWSATPIWNGAPNWNEILDCKSFSVGCKNCSLGCKNCSDSCKIYSGIFGGFFGRGIRSLASKFFFPKIFGPKKSRKSAVEFKRRKISVKTLSI